MRSKAPGILPSSPGLADTDRPLWALAVSSGRFFPLSPQNTVPFLVLLRVYLAAGEALPQGLLGGLFVNYRITGDMAARGSTPP